MLYFPGLNENLLSVKSLYESDYDVMFMQNEYEIRKDDTIIAKIVKS